MTTKSENREGSDWDVESMTEQILIDLNGSVSRSTVEEVLREIAPNFESARIQTFVPLFIRREALNRLRAEIAAFDSQEAGLHDAEIGVEVV